MEGKCVMVINGVHGEISHNCSKTQWRSMTLEARLAAATGVDIQFVSAEMLKNASVEEDFQTKQLIVTDYEYSSFYRGLTRLCIALKKQEIWIALSDAIWLKQECRFANIDFNFNFNLFGSVRKNLSREDFFLVKQREKEVRNQLGWAPPRGDLVTAGNTEDEENLLKAVAAVRIDGQGAVTRGIFKGSSGDSTPEEYYDLDGGVEDFVKVECHGMRRDLICDQKMIDRAEYFAMHAGAVSAPVDPELVNSCGRLLWQRFESAKGTLTDRRSSVWNYILSMSYSEGSHPFEAQAFRMAYHRMLVGAHGKEQYHENLATSLEEDLAKLDLIEVEPHVFGVSEKVEELKGTWKRALNVLDKADSAAEGFKVVTDKVGGMLDMLMEMGKGFLTKTLPGLLAGLSDVLLLVDFVRSIVYKNITTFVFSLIRLGERIGLGAAVMTSLAKYFGNLLAFAAGRVMDLGDDSADEFTEDEEGYLVDKKTGKRTMDYSVSNGAQIMRDARVAVEEHGIGDAIPILFGIVGTFVTGEVCEDKQVAAAVNKFRLFNSMIPAAKSISSLLENLTEMLPECIQAWLRVLCPEAEWKSLVRTDFKKWYDQVDALLMENPLDRIWYDDILQKGVLRVAEDGKKYMSIAAQCKEVSPKLYNLIIYQFKRIDKLVEVMDSIRGMRGERAEPFSIALAGIPGIGKTTLTDLIARLIAGPNVAPANLMYGRNPGTKHWDAYHNQEICVYDDFGAQIQKDGGGSDCGEFILVVSKRTMVLEMASLESSVSGKKGTCFTSKCVISCWNDPFPRDNNLRDIRAVYRRRHQLWMVTMHPDFPTTSAGAPDFARISVYDKKNFTFLKWQLIDPVNNKEITPLLKREITTVEALKMMKEGYIRHRETEKFLGEVRDSNDLVEEVKRMILDTAPHMFAGCDSVEDYLVNRFSGRKGPVEELEEHLSFVSAEDVFAAAESASLVLVEEQGLMEGIAKYSVVDEKISFAAVEKELEGGVLEWLKAHPLLASAVAFGASATAFHFLVKWYRKNVEVEVHSPPKEESRGAPKRLKRVAQGEMTVKEKRNEEFDRKYKNPFSAQALPETFSQGRALVKDKQMLALADECISPGILNVTVVSRKCVRRMCAFAFHADMILVPFHLFLSPDGDVIEDGATLTLADQAGMKISAYFSKENLVSLKSKNGEVKDSAVYRVGIAMRNYRSRIDNFIEDSETGKPVRKAGMLLSYRNSVYSESAIPEILELTQRMVYSSDENGIAERILSCGYQYQTLVRGGDCGGILMFADKSAVRKVCGIHVAGMEDKFIGFAEIVTQSMLREAVSHFKKCVFGLPVPEGGVSLEAKPLVRAQGDFTQFGVLEDKMRVRLPQKTDIIETMIFEKIGPHTTEPSVLSANDPRLKVKISPLMSGVAKYGKACEVFDESVLKQVEDDIFREFEGEEIRTLTEQEAIKGIPGIEYLNSMKRNTSPGYPYKALFRNSLKGDFVDEEGNVTSDELRKRLDLRYAAGRIGERVPSAWLDCTKMERRPLEKIAIGKTRVFTIAPMCYVIYARKYLLDFCRIFYESRHFSFSSVGMDVTGEEWNAMINWLHANSTLGFAGDFGRYDGTLSAQCMRVAFNVIQRVYGGTEEEELHREVIFNEMVHTVQIALDCVYATHWGNPSGNPLTLVINTLVNAVYFRYAWLKMAPLEMRNLAAFHNNVRMKICGDDNLVSVTLAALDFYNLQTVSGFFHSMGLEYLPPSKEIDTTTQYSKIVQLSFLKCTSHRVPELSTVRWVARMEWNVIVEMTNWIRECDDEWKALYDNLQTALRFAFFHGRDRFCDLRMRMGKECLKIGKRPVLYSWAELLEIYLERHGFGGFYWQEMAEYIEVEEQSEIAPLHEERKEGTVMLNQAVPIVAEVAQPIPVQKMLSSMTDEPWSLAAMAERFSFVGSLNWLASDLRKAVIARYLVPDDLLQSPTMYTPFHTMQFWRGDVLVKFGISGNAMQQGLLYVAWIPLQKQATIDTWHALNFQALTSVPHAFLSPDIDNSVEVRIPFAHWKDYIKIDPTGVPVTSLDFLGMIYVGVFNQMQVATGVSNFANVTVHAALVKPEFHIPQNVSVIMRRGGEDDFVRVEPHGNTITSNVTNVIKKAGDITMPIETVADKFDTNADVRGFDKVNVGLQPSYMVRKPLGYLSHAENVEFLQRLSLHPNSLAVCSPEDFGTKQDEMNLKYLCTMMNFRDVVNLSNQSFGAVLWQAFLCPMDETMRVPFGGSRFAVGSTITPTTLSAFSAKHTYWRGGLKYRFQFISSKFHRTRVAACVNYGSRGAITNATALMNGIVTYFDLSDCCHEFEVVVPYVNDKKFLHVPAGDMNLLGTTATPFSANDYASRAMGTITLMVMNGLSHPDNVPNNIDINVWMAGADDFTLMQLGMNNIGLVPVTAQGDTVPMTVQDGECVQTTTVRAAVPVMPARHFGEEYTTIRDILKRYNLVTRLQNGSVRAVNFTNPRIFDASFGGVFAETWPTAAYVHNVFPLPAAMFLSNGAHAYFCSMYAVWRGSIRYKFSWDLRNTQGFVSKMFLGFSANDEISEVGGSVGDLVAQYLKIFGGVDATSVHATSASPNFTTATDMTGQNFSSSEGFVSGTSLPMDVADTSAGYHEVEVPFVSPYNVLSVWQGQDFVPTSNGYLFAGFDGSPTQDALTQVAPTLTVLGAAGDDFRLGMYLGPHTMFAGGFQSVVAGVGGLKYPYLTDNYKPAP